VGKILLMRLEEAMDAVVSKAEAITEIRRHNQDPAEFFREVGERDEYVGSEVLEWLGY
jgi:hypothetical protein